MGYGDFFQFTADEYLNVVLSTPYGQEKGITIDKIREKNYLRCDNDPTIAFEGGVFGTADVDAAGERHAAFNDQLVHNSPRGLLGRAMPGPSVMGETPSA